VVKVGEVWVEPKLYLLKVGLPNVPNILQDTNGSFNYNGVTLKAKISITKKHADSKNNRKTNLNTLVKNASCLEMTEPLKNDYNYYLDEMPNYNIN
jgi:hypothetical protein